MELKKKIIENLNKLKISYYSQKDKQWQIKALNIYWHKKQVSLVGWVIIILIFWRGVVGWRSKMN